MSIAVFENSWTLILRSSISMSIYTPTYLYIKQHSISGKLYFGKTIKNPDKYLGSGKHWQRHIKKHGKEHVVTLWCELFDNVFDLIAFAISFSNKMDIVESTSWLNLIPENGLDGAAFGQHGPLTGKFGINHPRFGKKNTIKQNSQHSNDMVGNSFGKNNKGKIQSKEHIEKRSVHMFGNTYGNINKGIKRTSEQNMNNSLAQSGYISAYDLKNAIYVRILKSTFVEFKNIRYVGVKSNKIPPR